VKVKVTIDGVEKEIELDDEKFMTVEQHKLRLGTQIKKRLDRHSAELLQDEEFVAKVLQSKGIDPKNPKGSGKETDTEAVQRAQQDVRAREVEPLKKQLEEAGGKLTTTRKKQLVSELETHLIAGGVDKGIARRLAEVEVNRDVFGFDEEHEGWAVKEGDGFAFSPNATKERPYKGVEHFAADWVKDKANAPFVTGQQQKGPGVQQTQLGGGTGSVKSKADLKSPQDSAAFIKEHGFDAYAALPLK
jgi:hypothetical protein